jgi:single-strand DNA-binding protein
LCGDAAVFIEGRIQSRSWEGQDGQKRSTTEVIADNVQFLRGAGPAGKAGDSSAKGDVIPQDVATINLNEEISPIPGNDESAKGSKTTTGDSDEPPF